MSVVYPNNFPTGANLRAVLLNLAPVGILVCGMMLLMIAGSFDLSCGSTLALAGVWAGVVAGWWGWPAEIAILVGIARRRAGRPDQRPDRDAHRHQRADRHARHADHLPQPDLCHRRHRRHADLRRLRRLWPRRRPHPAHPVALLGDARHRAASAAGWSSRTPLLPPVLFRRRQSARRAAFGHPRRSADPHRLHHHGRARRHRRRASARRG